MPSELRCHNCLDFLPTFGSKSKYCSPSCRARDNTMRNKYGINAHQRRQMIADQDGRCAICNVDLETVRAVVDHNHRTGKARAILCPTCNVALGLMGDNIERGYELQTYLARHELDLRDYCIS